MEILTGVCPPEVLVTLSTEEMATAEVKEARKSTEADSRMSKRSDYYTIKRAEILREAGLDPDAGGEFTCRKCKSDKTSHYSLQTRSSDEPMTVFIQCLKCYNRWRQ